MGFHSDYRFADTWYPSWAADGNLYSPWTDGPLLGDELFVGCVGSGHQQLWRISGSCAAKPPPARRPDWGRPRQPHREEPGQGPGRSASLWRALSVRQPGLSRHLVLRHVLPLTRGARPASATPITTGPGLGRWWDSAYPATWVKTWEETPHTPAKPLFGESGMWGHPVKIGAPHFVDFGKDMEHSPDGKAYLVATGAEAHRSATALREPELDHRRPGLFAARDAFAGNHQRSQSLRVLRGARRPGPARNGRAISRPSNRCWNGTTTWAA